MDIIRVKAIFEDQLCSHIFNQFSYQFQLSGLFDFVQDEEVIVSFLSMYDFPSEQKLYFDEFRYFYKCYCYQYEKNSLEFKSIF